MSNLRVDELESLATGRSVSVDSIDTDVRQDLASPDKGAAMVARAVIYAGSVEEVESMSLPVGTAVFLTEEGRAGEFVVKAGTSPSDPLKGIYIVLGSDTYAERIYSGALNVQWFGAIGDGIDDDYPSIQAAMDYAVSSGNRNLYFPVPKDHYRFSQTLIISGHMAVSGGVGTSHSEVRPVGNHPVFTLSHAQSVTISGFHFNADVYREGVGIYGYEETRKVFISNNDFDRLDVGIRGAGTWTYYLKENTIHHCRIGVSFYRDNTASPWGETTTIYILDSSIWSNTEYNIAVGLPSEPGFSVGRQCTTLVIRNNMMDDGPVYVSDTANTAYESNHTELASVRPALQFSSENPSSSNITTTVKNNYFRGPSWSNSTGIKFFTQNHIEIDISNNYFVGYPHKTIDLSELVGSSSHNVKNNRGTTFNNIVLPYRTDTQEVADSSNFVIPLPASSRSIISSENGKFFYMGPEIPTEGRFKSGTIFTLPHPVIEGTLHVEDKYVFVASRRGMSRIENLSHTASVDASSNTVTPSNIDLFYAGDRITISGAGPNGGDLACQVRQVDYEKGTFTTHPTVSSSTSSSTVDFSRGRIVPLAKQSNIANDTTMSWDVLSSEPTLFLLTGFSADRSALLHYSESRGVTLVPGQAPPDIEAGGTSNPDLNNRVNIWGDSDGIHVRNRVGNHTEIRLTFLG